MCSEEKEQGARTETNEGEWQLLREEEREGLSKVVKKKGKNVSAEQTAQHMQRSLNRKEFNKREEFKGGKGRE